MIEDEAVIIDGTNIPYKDVVHIIVPSRKLTKEDFDKIADRLSAILDK